MNNNSSNQTTKRKIDLPTHKATEKQMESIRAKREELKALSVPFKQLVAIEAISSINEGLVAMYAEQGHTELKTLKQWNEAGKKVIKGEHAFLLWGSPKPIKKDKNQSPEADNENKESDFFPICFVFSQNQVEERKQTA